jgi:hypothetical protein
MFKRDRAPPFERPVPRTPHEACSSQVLPRHTRGAPYRCSLPGLAGFDASRCVGPNLRRRLMRLTRHDTPSGGDSTPLERIAGYRAPLPPRLARPHREPLREDSCNWRRGRDSNPRHSCPCTAFPVPHLRPLGHPSASRRGSLVTPRKMLAEGRGFEPPRDLRPYPISSRTPSTGLGHPSANSRLTSRYRRVSKNTLSNRAASSGSTPPVAVAR